MRAYTWDESQRKAATHATLLIGWTPASHGVQYLHGNVESPDIDAFRLHEGPHAFGIRLQIRPTNHERKTDHRGKALVEFQIQS